MINRIQNCEGSVSLTNDMHSRKTLGRLTVTISKDLILQLASIRDRHAVSVSAIAEIAVRTYLDTNADRDLGELLRAAGAKIRR
jgi:hypothetical protein